MSKRYTITSALPYANGPVHIGHLAGVYVPADAYARYLRSTGNEVLFLCGSDEHGVPITIRAKKEGITPQEVVDKYHQIIKKSFEDFGISFDVYSRTSSQIHKETSSEFFTNLYNKGSFKEIFSDQYYDEEANQFLADRYIKGTCPHCGNTEAYGDQCEKCGSTLSPDELISPRSALSGNVPIKKATKHWFLPLDEYEGWLREWILDGHKDWKTNVYGQCKSWIEQGLHPRAVTRDLDWGVPVPLDEAKGKVLYVWFDAPIGYISATKEWAQSVGTNWENYWKEGQSNLVHFIGKDNIVFHCIIFPAMLKAYGGLTLPLQVPANEFLNLEGDKISTSRNWAVWLHEYLDEFPNKQDVLRYTLCANAPETKDNDFTWKDLQARNNNELVAILGNFINRVWVLNHKYYEGVIPAANELTEYEHSLVQIVGELKNQVSQSIENYRFREALQTVMDVARAGNKYLADTEPWKLIKTNPERVSTIMNYSTQLAVNLSILCEPFLPFTSSKILQMSNTTLLTWSEIGRFDILKAGHLINEPQLLFDKIEDDAIEAQVAKLKASKAEIVQQSNTAEPSTKELISFDDFTKLDLRTATILEAERVPKTNKLLKLTLDLGYEKRTVVSGIAGSYDPENIIGTQVTLLANLAPREIKGIMSQGMILMAKNVDETLSFVSPDKKVANGSDIA